MKRPEILAWLREDDPDRLETLWQLADETRRAHVGDAVHLRGLVEISNHCVRRCGYCGLRIHNREVQRYRMTHDEILACAHEAVGYGYGTLVMQAGEDPGLRTEWVAELIRRLKAETPLAVTLSLGERSDADLIAWREAGADRYLLRFETSDRNLYNLIHPGGAEGGHRIELLQRIKAIGYETGSGVMVGIPGQTCDTLADDLEWFARLDLHMIGVGPYIAHPGTPLGQAEEAFRAETPDQTPADETMTCKVMALARLMCPDANIPSTTALATINPGEGREMGLRRGANVVMPNLTPPTYRICYEIYPGKACAHETAAQCSGCIRSRIEALGRSVGSGRGDSPRYQSAARDHGARPAQPAPAQR